MSRFGALVGRCVVVGLVLWPSLLAAQTVFVADDEFERILALPPAPGTDGVVVSADDILAINGGNKVAVREFGIVQAPDGDLFFSEEYSHSIFRVAPDGTGLALVVAPTGMPGGLSANSAVEKLAISADGNTLYALDDGEERLLQIQVSPTVGVSVLATAGQLAAVGGAGLVEAGLVRIGDDLFFGVEDTETVLRYSLGASNPLSVLASGDQILAAIGPDDGFVELAPYMAAAPNGDLIVAVRGSEPDRLVRITQAGDISVFLYARQIGSVAGDDQPDLLGGFGFDAAGNFYLADNESETITFWPVKSPADGTIDTLARFTSARLFTWQSQALTITGTPLDEDIDLRGDLTLGALSGPAPKLDLTVSPADQVVAHGGAATFSVSLANTGATAVMTPRIFRCHEGPQFADGDTNDNALLDPAETWTWSGCKHGVMLNDGAGGETALTIQFHATGFSAGGLATASGAGQVTVSAPTELPPPAPGMYVTDNLLDADDSDVGRIFFIPSDFDISNPGASPPIVAVTTLDILGARANKGDVFLDMALSTPHRARFTDNGIDSDNAGNFYFSESRSDGIFKLPPDGPLVMLATRVEIAKAVNNDPTLTVETVDPELDNPGVSERGARPEKIGVGNDGFVYVGDIALESFYRVHTLTGEVTPLVLEVLDPERPEIPSFETLIKAQPDPPPSIDVDLRAGNPVTDGGIVFFGNDETAPKYARGELFSYDLETGGLAVVTRSVPCPNPPEGCLDVSPRVDGAGVLVIADLDGFMDVTPNGDVLTADSSTSLNTPVLRHRILRINPVDGADSVFLTAEDVMAVTGASDAIFAGGLGYDPDGNFYVTDDYSENIVRFPALDASLGTIDATAGEVVIDQDTLLIQIDGNAQGDVGYVGGFEFRPEILTNPELGIAVDPATQVVSYLATATVTVNVTNTGDAPIIDVALSASAPCADGEPTLQSGNVDGPAMDPSETWVYTCVYDEVETGFLVTFAVTATDLLGNPVDAPVCDPPDLLGCATAEVTVAPCTGQCDDGVFCNGAEGCDAETGCQPGADPCAADECPGACDEDTQACLPPTGDACADDGNACTDDVCDSEGACTHPANDLACDDGAACTTGDVCADGVCAGAPIDCSDLDGSCQLGACDETGACVAQPANAGGECDDSDACTVTDLCDDTGACAGAAVDCSELDSACTVGQCDAQTGECAAAVADEGGKCDDGDICTLNDICVDGTCAGQKDANCEDDPEDPEEPEDPEDPVEPDNPDTDGDGVSNEDEGLAGTDPDDADTDDDGLSDGDEINGKGPLEDEGWAATDPLDADSDDDGVSDGDEAKGTGPNENYGPTDPNDSDTDDDGLPDGLEVGVTERIPGGTSDGPAAIATSGTEEGQSFIADDDPATTTDPTAKDTDNGGLPDGDEDLNSDGRFASDGSEKDPNDPSDDVDPVEAAPESSGCSCKVATKGHTAPWWSWTLCLLILLRWRRRTLFVE